MFCFYLFVVGHLPSSLPLGAMEADDTGRREGRKPDVGFKSKESDQLLDFLRTVQHSQFRLICIRVSQNMNPHLFCVGVQILFCFYLCLDEPLLQACPVPAHGPQAEGLLH